MSLFQALVSEKTTLVGNPVNRCKGGSCLIRDRFLDPLQLEFNGQPIIHPLRTRSPGCGPVVVWRS
jgi:hypothetical protein